MRPRPHPLLALALLPFACTGREKPSDPAPDSPADTADDEPPPALPTGDNLVQLGLVGPPSELSPPEFTGLIARDDGFTFTCGGAVPAQVYAHPDPAAPALSGTVIFPRPANTFRCQHLALVGADRLVATHHGDETAAPWVGLADITDPTAAVGLAAWSDGETALEGVAVQDQTLYVAAHDAGVLVFDLSDDALDAPTTLSGLSGAARSLALRDTRLAVGTTEGEVQIRDLDAGTTTSLAVSGPVYDLLWLDDQTLIAACGASGLDRVDLAAGAVSHHLDADGAAVDLAALPDGAFAVAAWGEVLVLDGADLSQLSAEDPVGPGEAALVLALDAVDDLLVVGEWRSFYTYRWDPTVAAPDLDLDARRVDLGAVAAGETGHASLVLSNRGPQALTVSAIAADDAAISVAPAALTVPAGEAKAVSLAWTSTGAPLDATLTIQSDDPDEGSWPLAVGANQAGLGVGDPLPDFTYLAVNGAGTYRASDLGGPALLSYFATF